MKKYAVLLLDKVINLLYYLCPFFENYVYKKKMLKKIKDIEDDSLPLSYMDGYEKLTIEEIERFHSKTFEYKKLFEDKAKTSLFSITISITLIVSFIDLIFKIQYFRILAIFFVIVAFANLVLAGKMAFDVIGNLNIFYELSPSEIHQKKKIKKETLAYATEHNVNYNIIRNNHVYLSYKSIAVALVAIAFIGILYITGKAVTPATPDKQIETLIQINESLRQNKSSLEIVANSIKEMSDNSVSSTEAIDQMKDTLQNLQLQKVLNGSNKQAELIEKLIELLENKTEAATVQDNP